jgi:hypothetical protein
VFSQGQVDAAWIQASNPVPPGGDRRVPERPRPGHRVTAARQGQPGKGHAEPAALTRYARCNATKARPSPRPGLACAASRGQANAVATARLRGRHPSARAALQPDGEHPRADLVAACGATLACPALRQRNHSARPVR